jgi:hypothetical protein
MTKRGSLAYYMSAVVFGSLFVSATFWLYRYVTPEASIDFQPFAADLFASYMLAAVEFLISFLLQAFILRRVATRFRWQKVWIWVSAGAVIFVAVEWILAAPLIMLRPWNVLSGWNRLIIGLLDYGPYEFVVKPVWLWPLPGLAASYILFLVYRAFELQHAAPPSVRV